MVRAADSKLREENVLAKAVQAVKSSRGFQKASVGGMSEHSEHLERLQAISRSARGRCRSRRPQRCNSVLESSGRASVWIYRSAGAWQLTRSYRSRAISRAPLGRLQENHDHRT